MSGKAAEICYSRAAAYIVACEHSVGPMNRGVYRVKATSYCAKIHVPAWIFCLYPVFHARADKFCLNKMSVCSQNSGSITRIVHRRLGFVMVVCRWLLAHRRR